MRLHTTGMAVWMVMAACAGFAASAQDTTEGEPVMGTLYCYTLMDNGTQEAYDEALAVACLQGIINRDGPSVYVLLPTNDAAVGKFGADRNTPRYWLDTLSTGGRWLEGRPTETVAGLDALVKLAGDRVKGAVIWDPAVPATVNVATTIAGVRDGVALSPEFADRYLDAWGWPVLDDLRGRFDGSETGSAKNDAYRWAVREYLAKGLCTSKFLFLYEDTWEQREKGGTGYVVTRDWAVYHRGFVYDLSPWGDETPKDDPDQTLGTDLETYHLMLAETMKQADGEHMTEVAGFFNFQKYSNVPGYVSKHEPVPTEWETVWLISPYNGYQNTVASSCFNQSLHSQAPFKPLKQPRIVTDMPLENKTYLCFLMADYDSATPLYDFMPKHWADPARGSIPLVWGVNPNLLDTYPDVISYFYETATENDVIQSDASAAGYMNPNRVREEHMPLFIRHNQHYYRISDQTMAPMVLDWDEPTPAVKDAFTQFAPDGFATIVMDLHNTGGKNPEPHVWKGMPVTELHNNICNYAGADTAADGILSALSGDKPGEPAFHFFRVVWVGPQAIIDTVEALREKQPGLDFEVVDPFTFFRLFKEHYEKG
jgi:hypothetical protein